MILTILDYNSGGVYVYKNPMQTDPNKMEEYIQDVLEFNLDEIYWMYGKNLSIEIMDDRNEEIEQSIAL